jgi:hypothetical protein
VPTVPARSSGASSGWNAVVSLLLRSTSTWPTSSPSPWVTAPTRWTRVPSPRRAPRHDFPSSATAPTTGACAVEASAAEAVSASASSRRGASGASTAATSASGSTPVSARRIVNADGRRNRRVNGSRGTRSRANPASLALATHWAIASIPSCPTALSAHSPIANRHGNG